MKTALVTGSAGFIGYHMSRRLLTDGWRVIGIDAMTDYYDPGLKHARHDLLNTHEAFTPVIARIEAAGVMADLMESHRPDTVIHLAAQAGVRYSIDAPRSYVDANLLGTFEVLEAARGTPPRHLLLASTSSVYGANEKMPYAEVDRADHPMSFYAATKKATEAMAHSYAHLYDLPTTMFRFFTVYGPWGRPDMALFKFTRAILEGQPIDVYNRGDQMRDFTFVDDLIEGVARLMPVVPTPPATGAADSLSPIAPFRVVNLGNGAPTRLMDFIQALESVLGKEAQKNMLPAQPGDVFATWADTTLVESLVGDLPRTPLADGMARFVDWYRQYYKL